MGWGDLRFWPSSNGDKMWAVDGQEKAGDDGRMAVHCIVVVCLT